MDTRFPSAPPPIIERVFALELDKLPTERLEAEIARLYSRISAEMCRWLLLVGEYDRREAYLEWGCRSTAHWLSWHCGIGIRTAYEHVRVGRALAELPLIREAYSRGELSYSKVRALTRIAGSESEAELLELARNTSGAQLERVASRYRRGLAPEELDALRERRDLRSFADGMFDLRAQLTPEEGELVRAALEHAAGRIQRERREEAQTAEHGERVPPVRWGALRADALVRMAEVYLAAAETADSSGGDRTQVVVHVDADALAAAPSEGVDPARRCELADGHGIHPETARRLACDAAVVALSERGGRPLSVGRKTRTIPPAIRRALRARDGTCAFPGCTAKRFLDAHHIRHWAHGGETSLSNLVSLCRYHHRLVHEGRFTVEMRRSGPIFRRPSGAEVPRVPKPAPPRPRILGSLPKIPPAPVGPDGRLEPPLAPCSGRFGGESMDLDHTLFVMLQRVRRAGPIRPEVPDPP